MSRTSWQVRYHQHHYTTPLSCSEIGRRLLTFFLFSIGHVSRDGRDLAILGIRHRVLLVRDFEHICRGEASLVDMSQDLYFFPVGQTYYLAFEHGRICVATVRCLYTISPTCTHSSLHFLKFWQMDGLYVINVDRSPSIDSAKVVLVRPCLDSELEPHHEISCMQLTDRRIYFTWEDARRGDVALFKDEQDALWPTPPVTLSPAEQLGEPWPWEDLEFGRHCSS